MKLLLPAFILGVMSVSAYGQSKLNGAAAILASEYNSGTQLNNGVLKAPAEDKRVGVLVLVNNTGDLSPLENLGAEIQWISDDIVAIDVPASQLQAISELPIVEYVEYTPNMRAMLDFARPASQVTAAQTGFQYNGANHSFTGKGVLTGLMDNGIDPNHINFFGKDGKTRVKAVFDFGTGVSSNPISYTTPDEIEMFTTDTRTESHGTHVAGIMAGSYNGEGRYAYVTRPTGTVARTTSGNIPYYGVATESNIAMACGSFTSTAIGAAVRNIFSKAIELGLPAVVNLSLGNNAGPHDGTDLFTRSIANQTSNGIICVSAGNEGDVPLFINYKFTSTDTDMKTYIVGNTANGNIEIWGKDDKPFTVKLIMYANSGGTITDVFELPSSGSVNSTSSSVFRTNFSGSVVAQGNVSTLNKRYNVTLQMGNVKPSRTGYSLGIQVLGTDGQEIWVYASGAGSTDISFTDNNRSGWTNGSCAGTINSLACANNVISVGSYNTRTTWGNIDVTGSYSYQSSTNVVDGISDFSSWGKTFQGKQLPTVCAPGSVLVSSFSSYYVESTNSRVSAQAENSYMGKTDYWGAMQGTSMSSPYAAGVVALWLEAYPSLTAVEAIKIIEQTSEKADVGSEIIGDYDQELADRWGAGKIDAVAGLKYIMDNFGSVGSIVDDSKALIVEPVDGGYSVFVGGEQAIAASLYDLQGREVYSVSAADNELVVPTSALSAGVYVLKVNGANAAYIRKLNVK
ncbi:MAG: S8 family peptidase [Muribaculaceae bacterium]|nr:S8 family peptidase [Muribaculaceae bacterium]